MKYEAWSMNVSWTELKTPSLTLNNRSICLPNSPSNLTLDSYFLRRVRSHICYFKEGWRPSDPITAAWLTLCLLDQINKEVWSRWLSACWEFHWLWLWEGPFRTEGSRADTSHSWCPLKVSSLHQGGRGGVGQGTLRAFDRPCKNSKGKNLTMFWPSSSLLALKGAQLYLPGEKKIQVLQRPNSVLLLKDFWWLTVLVLDLALHPIGCGIYKQLTALSEPQFPLMCKRVLSPYKELKPGLKKILVHPCSLGLQGDQPSPS